jgi:hypothetical protein
MSRATASFVVVAIFIGGFACGDEGGDDGGGGTSDATGSTTGAATTMPTTSTTQTTNSSTTIGSETTTTSAEGSSSADSMGTTPAESSSAASSEGSSGGAGMCGPEDVDDDCRTCLKMACCDAWLMCRNDESCACTFDCHLGGGALNSCENMCNHDGQLYEYLFFCGQMTCLGTCDWDCC